MSSIPNQGSTQPEAKILSVIDVPATDPNRMGKLDARITYQVDPLHIFAVQVPAENLTPEIEDAAVRADYAKRSKLINRSIKLQ